MPRLPERAARGLAFLLLVLPWVQPFSSGPSRNVWPWLISAACFAGVLLLRRHLDLRLALKALLAAALINSAMALPQYFGQASSFAPWVWPVGPGEAFGNLRQRNQFGSLTAMGLGALGALVALPRTPAASGGAMPCLAWPAVLLLALGNAASQSRTGLLAWLLVALAWAWFCLRHRRSGAGLALAAAALALLATVALPKLLAWTLPATGAGCALADCGAIGRLAGSGADPRIPLWANVLTLIAQRPWMGWGWGELDYAHFITLFSGERFPVKPGNAHNLPLHLAVELGLPLALLLCGTVLALLWRARPWQERDPERWAVWCVLAVMGLHSLLEYPLWYGPFQIALLLGLAALWRRRPAASGVWIRSRWPGGLALGLLLGVGLASVDYLRVSQPFLPPAQRSAWLPDGPWPGRTLWFREQADFATLALTPVNEGNAQALHALARQLLHYSPEPLVVEKLLDSAALLGRTDEVAFYARRYQAAYPQEHAHWLAQQKEPPTEAPYPSAPAP